MAIRIVDGVAYEVKRTGPFKIKAVDLGSGHLEAVAARTAVAVELEWSPSVVQDHLDMVAKYREDHADEVAAAHAKRAASGAKKRIRQLCKANGASTLLTLTYRANELDLARVKRDLKEFNRRLLRHLPGFGFVGAFEQQKRGAWHVHCAIRNMPSSFVVKQGAKAVRVKSYDLLRSVWRSITKERGGTVNIARSKGERSPGRIASYIAKYATKAYAEGQKWSNRWTKYGFDDVPKAVDLGQVDGACDAIELVYGLLSKGQQVASSMWSRFGDWFYLAGERERLT